MVMSNKTGLITSQRYAISQGITVTLFTCRCGGRVHSHLFLCKFSEFYAQEIITISSFTEIIKKGAFFEIQCTFPSFSRDAPKAEFYSALVASLNS